MRNIINTDAYFPAPGDWARVGPAEAGFDPARLAEAVAFAEANESPWPRTMYLETGEYIGTADMGEAPPWNDVLGEVRPRGGAGGLVIRSGRIAAEWGDTNRRDMTFSIAKSYLAVLAGVAVERGLIRSIDDPVRDYSLDDGFTSPQNRDITWRHLLDQTSEWEGTLFDKPDAEGGAATVGLQWGIFAALLAAGALVAAGARVRAVNRPEPPNPAADQPAPGPQQDRLF